MPIAVDIPDLAVGAPLWLALLTVGVNALVGALRGYTDHSRHWDIVGVSAFALLMGLGGGFIRDVLIGNLPAETLRSPWYLVTVLVAISVVLVVGSRLIILERFMTILNSLALGLFAVTGAAYALDFGLPAVSAVLVGTISAVGGGMLVSLLQGHVPDILVAGAPNALLAVWGATTYVILAQLSSSLASILGIAVVVVAQIIASAFGLETRRAGSRRKGSSDGKQN